jgi:hypothetical protein
VAADVVAATAQRGEGTSVKLLVLTAEPDPTSVLPALALLPHKVCSAALRVAALRDAGLSDAVIVDAPCSDVDTPATYAAFAYWKPSPALPSVIAQAKWYRAVSSSCRSNAD